MSIKTFGDTCPYCLEHKLFTVPFFKGFYCHSCDFGMVPWNIEDKLTFEDLVMESGLYYAENSEWKNSDSMTNFYVDMASDEAYVIILRMMNQ